MRFSRRGAGRGRTQLLSKLRARMQARSIANAAGDTKASKPELDEVSAHEARRLLLYGMSIPFAIFIGVMLAAFLSVSTNPFVLIIGVLFVAPLALWMLGNGEK